MDAIADLLTPEFRELLGVEADEETQTGEFDTLVGQASAENGTFAAAIPSQANGMARARLGSAAGMQVTYLGVMEVDWASLFQAKAAAEDEINCYEVACVALTFDDGPSVYTEGLLDILQEHEVQVTFFILGQSARIQSETVSRMFAEGHQIGNHTWNHPNLTQLSDELIQQQIQQTDDIVTQVIGQPTQHLRPPYGAYNDRVMGGIRSADNLLERRSIGLERSRRGDRCGQNHRVAGRGDHPGPRHPQDHRSRGTCDYRKRCISEGYTS